MKKIWILLFSLISTLTLAQLTASIFDELDTPEKVDQLLDDLNKWDGKKTGEFFETIKRQDPNQSAIKSMRELNQHLEGNLQFAEKFARLKRKQARAMAQVRDTFMSVRHEVITKYKRSNVKKYRSIYGYLHNGSWLGNDTPNVNQDIDSTILGIDKDVNWELKNEVDEAVVKTLNARRTSNLSMTDYDIVVVAEGYEGRSGVYESEGAKKGVIKSAGVIEIVDNQGKKTEHSFAANTSNRSSVINQLEDTKKLKRLSYEATKNSDYNKIFNKDGTIKDDFFKSSKSGQMAEMRKKYSWFSDSMETDQIRSKMSTATGACVDMYKHLVKEVIGEKYDEAATLKKTLKYIQRANGYAVDGGAKTFINNDPLLSDQGYRHIIDLSNQMHDRNRSEFESKVKELYGNNASAGLQDLQKKSRAISERYIELCMHAEIDNIVLNTPDAGTRQRKIQDLRNDLMILADTTDDTKIAAFLNYAQEGLNRLSQMNQNGQVEGMKEHWEPVQDLIKDPTLGERAMDFLSQSEFGQRIINDGLTPFLQWGNQEIFTEDDLVKTLGVRQSTVDLFKRQRRHTLDFAIDIYDSAVQMGSKNVQRMSDIMDVLSFNIDTINAINNSNDVWELSEKMAGVIINFSTPLKLLNLAYVGIYKGDNEALAKAIIYMIFPSAALPDAVKQLGEGVITLSAQSLFDSQLDALYDTCTKGKKGWIISWYGGRVHQKENEAMLAGIRETRDLIEMVLGPGGAALLEDTLSRKADNVIIDATQKVDDLLPINPLDQDGVAAKRVKGNKLSDTGKGVSTFMKAGVAKSIHSTIVNGNPLLFTDDGPLMSACTRIKKINEELLYLATAFEIDCSINAIFSDNWNQKLDKGQTRAMETLMGAREDARKDAKTALINAIVRTFNARCRAEKGIDEDQMKPILKELREIYKKLDIEELGMDSVQALVDKWYSRAITPKMWLTGEDKRDVFYMKTAQEHLDAYKKILNIIEKVEDSVQKNLGEKIPHTALRGNPPYYGDPKRDLHFAQYYFNQFEPLFGKALKRLEGIKGDKLSTAYDIESLENYCKAKLEEIEYDSKREAAKTERKTHWVTEVYDIHTIRKLEEEYGEKRNAAFDRGSKIIEDFVAYYKVPENLDLRTSCSIPKRKADLDFYDADPGEKVTVELLVYSGSELVSEGVLSKLRVSWNASSYSETFLGNNKHSYRLPEKGKFQISAELKNEDDEYHDVEVLVFEIKESPVEEKTPSKKQQNKKKDSKKKEKTSGKGFFEGLMGALDKVDEVLTDVSEGLDEIGSIFEDEEEPTPSTQEPSNDGQKSSDEFDDLFEDNDESDNFDDLFEEEEEFIDETDEDLDDLFEDEPYETDEGSSLDDLFDKEESTRTEDQEFDGDNFVEESTDKGSKPKTSNRGQVNSNPSVGKPISIQIPGWKNHSEERNKLELGFGFIYPNQSAENTIKGGISIQKVSRMDGSGELNEAELMRLHETYCRNKTNLRYETGKHQYSSSKISFGNAKGVMSRSYYFLKDIQGTDQAGHIKGDDFILTDYYVAVHEKIPNGIDMWALWITMNITQRGENKLLSDAQFKILAQDLEDQLVEIVKSIRVRRKKWDLPGMGEPAYLVDHFEFQLPRGRTISIEATGDESGVVLSKTSSKPIEMIGEWITFNSKVNESSNGSVFRWETNTDAELKFKDKKNGSKNRIKFLRPGNHLVWIELLKKDGDSYRTVGESNQVSVSVTGPQPEIKFSPKEPFIDETVKVTVTEEPNLSEKYVDYRWLEPSSRSRRHLNSSASKIEVNRMKGDTPLEVLAVVPYHGDELGRAKAVIKPKLYQIEAKQDKKGPVPREWKEGMGLVERVQNLNYTTQLIYAQVNFKGKKPLTKTKVRWSWSANKGTVISNPISQNPTITRNEPGTADLVVKALNEDGVTLAQTSLQIQVSAPERK